jgi:hypothetical protein
MRNFVIFILLLISSLAGACGFYPYGEEVRFSILNPNNFRFKDFAPFYYSSNTFAPLDDNSYEKGSSEQLNIELWKKRVDRSVSEQAIFDAVYSADSMDENTNNPFLRYLYKNKDLEAIAYLRFAKAVSAFNNLTEDPWERYEYAYLPQRANYIKFAVEKNKTCKDPEIKLRYAFLALRLAYYNRDNKVGKEIYEDVFKKRNKKTIIDYWALYFRTKAEEEGAERNYHAAVVFMNAPDKRFQVQQLYSKAISIKATLQFAKTAKERAAVWLLDGIKKPARSMENIQRMYELDPHSEGLVFLILREMNKLEDWIGTPYYTYFQPSLAEQSDDGYVKVQKRIEKDRVYAQQLLQFVEGVNLEKISDPVVLKIAKSYLLFMMKDYASALNEIAAVEEAVRNNTKLFNQVELIKALCLTANQQEGSASIPEEIKPVLIKEQQLQHYRFIFAIARELEFKGNTTEAALLMSKLNPVVYELDTKNVYWKTKKNHATLYGDFYDNYFFYLDAQYTSLQVKELIKKIEGNNRKSVFDNWMCASIQKDVPRLYDLLGTKYIRQNNLLNALASFEKVNDTLWSSTTYYYKDYLDANPFYTNLYNEHTHTKADTINFNKESIVRTLLGYLKKANDVKNQDRDYYYFLIANCYLNMTEYGNSWMMRRYSWSSSVWESKMEDDKEYFSGDFAKQYYLKAKAASKNKKFAALCLRMAARCEEYSLLYKYQLSGDDLTYEALVKKIFKGNNCYSQIKKQYPEYYNDLVSNCECFESYFNSRR